MTGRHTGSFFLKVGAALFCIGHIIHNGVIFTRQLIPLLTEDYTGEKMLLYSCLSSLENRYINSISDTCSSFLAMAAGISQMIFVFLQMFMVFKYSNVIVNRSKRLAKIAFMHCLSTDICIWISTIINETMDYILLDAYKSMDHSKGPEYYGKFLKICTLNRTKF